jgi:ubiquinone/menaquinone biosynthesis C-methylase UbiE
MVNHLRERVEDSGLSNVELVRAGFLSYEHAGPLADAVYTRNALHHLPDFWKVIALGRIARMVRPGGVLRLHDLVYDFQPNDADRVFGKWFADAAGDPAEGYTEANYAEHIRTEYSTFRWLLEPMLDKAGFDIVDTEYRGAVFGAYTCLRRS